MIGHWRPVLRMARRDLRRHPVRALLTCLLVALPMVAATVAALASANSEYTRDVEATEQMRQADGVAVVSSWSRLDRREALWLNTSSTGGPAQRRDAGSVEVGPLLPLGSTATAVPQQRDVPLPTGGMGLVEFADLDDPLFAGGAELTGGRAPSAPDEVAVTEAAADELGLLTSDGDPADEALLAVADGPPLEVVGVVSGADSYGPALGLVAPLDSRLAPSDPQRPRYLVELPSLPRSELKELQGSLAAAGIAFSPRDYVLHPAAWEGRGGFDVTEAPDLTHLVVGALVMLVGMLEVVLLVGAAFAIAARRQVRDLGLLAANGGARSDLRRALLAQGLVLGGVSSVVGVGLGVVAFLEGVPLWERLLDRTMYRTEVDVPTLAVVALLGVVTAVVAALLPAWSTARLSPVAALSGRFPVKPGEARAHRGAFVLLGGGLVLTLAGGWFTARAFAPRAEENPLPPFVAGLGLVLMVVGAIWATPYVVRVVAGAGKGLPLAGRYAFRDAGRHRFRSAAAVMALTITVAGAVLSGFAFSSAAAIQEQQGGYQPPNSLVLYGDDTAAATATVEEVYGPVEPVRTRGIQLPRADTPKARGVAADRSLVVPGAPQGVRITDPGSLAVLVAAADREAAVTALEDGGLVVLAGTGVPDRDVAELKARGRTTAQLAVDRLPQTTVSSGLAVDSDADLLGNAFVSEATAERVAGQALSGRGDFAQTLLVGGEPFTQDVLDRLEVYGIFGQSDDPQQLRAEQAQYLGLVVAGLLSALVVGIAVAMASAESRDDVATLAAVGAGPWRRRSLGAMHGLFLGIVGCVLGLAVGVPSGLAFTQVDGLPGVDVPWLSSLGTVASVLVLGLVAGWLVTPSRLRLTRRTA
ncbi:FtsX-like permease family protein [Nocardioides sp. HDW12B]|uniref:FtsX-like permease family protein n=1 Tax=Nocardioides sp. HDW12B TaxID=2714939 RepID=UPI003211F0FE